MANEGKRFSMSPAVCIYLALLLLLMPFPWLVALFVAAAIHECFHLIAIRLVGGGRTSVDIYLQGVKIPLPEMSRGQELFCALAGPFGSLLLLVISSWAPRIAICGALQGIYNLLPLYPLDGGRAMECLLALFFSPPVAGKIQKITEIILLLFLLVIGIYGTFIKKLGLLPIVMVFTLLLRKNTLQTGVGKSKINTLHS